MNIYLTLPKVNYWFVCPERSASNIRRFPHACDRYLYFMQLYKKPHKAPLCLELDIWNENRGEFIIFWEKEREEK